jgi:hypothetical protein
MQIIRWTKGGFGMAAHNYDGDMLTDEVAQVHRSPGFITSNLIGKNDDGSLIKGELWKQRRGRFRCSFVFGLLCGGEVSLSVIVLLRGSSYFRCRLFPQQRSCPLDAVYCC